MKYEFGVMSSKWTLESNNDDIAFLTMVMHIGNPNIAIAIYNMNKTIKPMDILDMDNLEIFIEKNKDSLKKCRDSIKQV